MNNTREAWSFLENQMSYLLKLCKEDCNERWLHQAFGAIQLFVAIFPEEYEVTCLAWKTWKEEFEELIYGISLSM